MKEFLFDSWFLTRILQLMGYAKCCINLGPMLAILFVGTLMRALLITNDRGAPQGWAQDGMYMATWASLIQFWKVLVVGITTGAETHCDSDTLRGKYAWARSSR